MALFVDQAQTGPISTWILVRLLPCTQQDPEADRGVGWRTPFADRRSRGLGRPPNPVTLRLRRRNPVFGGFSRTARMPLLNLLHPWCGETVNSSSSLVVVSCFLADGRRKLGAWLTNGGEALRARRSGSATPVAACAGTPSESGDWTTSSEDPGTAHPSL